MRHTGALGSTRVFELQLWTDLPRRNATHTPASLKMQSFTELDFSAVMISGVLYDSAAKESSATRA